MLIQALAEYADTYLAEQLQDPAFEEKPVQYTVVLNEDGHFQKINVRQETVTQGKKSYVRALSLRVPKSPVSRAAGVHPLLACDAIQYVLGFYPNVWSKDTKAEENKHTVQKKGFIELIGSVAQNTQDAALMACQLFYEQEYQVTAAREALKEHKPQAGALVALEVQLGNLDSSDQGGIVIRRKSVREYWRNHYRSAFDERQQSGGEGRCIISGHYGSIAPTHDKIMGASSLGGQPSGVSLISFDKPSFRSYGWEQNQNAPVSPEQATAYIKALNDLMKSGQHRRGYSKDKVLTTRTNIAGIGFLYWTREPEDNDFVHDFVSAESKDLDQSLRLIRTEQNEAVSDNKFYLLAVSGNGGRLVVRDWQAALLKTVKQNIKQWFDDQTIADVFKKGERSSPTALWFLLKTLAPEHRDLGAKATSQAIQIFRRALFGMPLGYELLAAALDRLRVAKGNHRMNPARMGLIRAVVNDLSKKHTQGGIFMSDRLDETSDHPAYVCGRMLAVYENIQYAAQGEVNVNVVDRYFSMAMVNPQLAFPKLEDLSRAHLKKLRRDKPGAAVNLGRELDRLMEQLVPHGACFPGQMSLEDQGRFAIGYHHQKAEAARRRAKPAPMENGVALATTDQQGE